MQNLSDGEAYYRLLFEVTPLPALVYEIESWALLDANQAATEMYGYSRAELLRRTLADLHDPLDWGRVKQLILAQAAQPHSQHVQQHRRRTGESFAVEINAYPVRLSTGWARLALVQDISERVRADAELRASEQRYRELYEKANDAIYTHDLQGYFTSMNQAGERLLGYSHTELLGMSMAQLLPPEDLNHAKLMIARKLAGKPGHTVYEVRVRTKGGEYLTAEISSTLIYQDGKAVGVQGIARDMTERKRMEEQIRQVQKMNAVGRLAGGVAHDFNNRLTAILGFTDLLLKRTLAQDPRHYYLEQIKLASERATELTRQLLTFSREPTLEPQVLNLNDAASEWGNLVRVLLGENIQIQIILGAEVGLVKADPGQLEHVIMNLAINACDAMPTGGDFVLETTDIEISELQAQFNPAIPPGNYVRLLVKDTGCGMNEETLSHLFEPFFTTKDRGKGTGLGLFTAYGIIRQSGGYIEVKSVLGEGTSFLIYLPVVGDAQSRDLPRAAAAAAAARHETVLLVEDEPTVREVTREILVSEGYHVLEAAHGQAALELTMQYAERLDLVLTDVRMPGLSGYEMAEKLRILRPRLRVLFMSAYTDDVRVLAAAQTADFAYLQKPFTVNGLLQQVQNLLAQGQEKAIATA
jgi:two-component system, cell cycle sensor histidine kinase and response regulator CckA